MRDGVQSVPPQLTAAARSSIACASVGVNRTQAERRRRSAPQLACAESFRVGTDHSIAADTRLFVVSMHARRGVSGKTDAPNRMFDSHRSCNRPLPLTGGEDKIALGLHETRMYVLRNGRCSQRTQQHTRIHTDAHTCTCTYTYTYTCTCTCARARTHTRTHTHTHARTRIRTYAHTHTHTYTHTQSYRQPMCFSSDRLPFTD